MCQTLIAPLAAQRASSRAPARSVFSMRSLEVAFMAQGLAGVVLVVRWRREGVSALEQLSCGGATRDTMPSSRSQTACVTILSLCSLFEGSLRASDSRRAGP